MNNVNQDIKDKLVALANILMSKYPQYKNHFNDYILIEVKKDIKTKMGLAFSKGELTIALPEIRISTGVDGKTRNTITAFSFSNKADTSIPIVDVSVLEEVPMKIVVI